MDIIEAYLKFVRLLGICQIIPVRVRIFFSFMYEVIVEKVIKAFILVELKSDLRSPFFDNNVNQVLNTVSYFRNK